MRALFHIEGSVSASHNQKALFPHRHPVQRPDPNHRNRLCHPVRTRQRNRRNHRKTRPGAQDLRSHLTSAILPNHPFSRNHPFSLIHPSCQSHPFSRNLLFSLTLPALFLPAVSIGIMFVSPPVGILCLLGSFAFNMVTYFSAKRAIEPYLFTFRYVLRLLECARSLLEEPFPFYDKEREEMEKARKALAGFSMGSGLLMRNSGGISSGNVADIILDFAR